jgi:hypothetical protein
VTALARRLATTGRGPVGHAKLRVQPFRGRRRRSRNAPSNGRRRPFPGSQWRCPEGLSSSHRRLMVGRLRPVQQRSRACSDALDASATRATSWSPLFVELTERIGANGIVGLQQRQELTRDRLQEPRRSIARPPASPPRARSARSVGELDDVLPQRRAFDVLQPRLRPVQLVGLMALRLGDHPRSEDSSSAVQLRVGLRDADRERHRLRSLAVRPSHKSYSPPCRPIGVRAHRPMRGHGALAETPCTNRR